MGDRNGVQINTDCNLASPEASQQFERLSLQELKTRGYRMTMPRLQVIRALGETHRALSPYEIHDRIVRSGGRIDVVSVYRILSTLEESGLAHHIASVNGYIPCRQGGDHGDQQRFVCRQCGCVTELDIPEGCSAAIARITTDEGFDIDSVKLEIVGVCRHCQKSR